MSESSFKFSFIRIFNLVFGSLTVHHCHILQNDSIKLFSSELEHAIGIIQLFNETPTKIFFAHQKKRSKRTRWHIARFHEQVVEQNVRNRVILFILVCLFIFRISAKKKNEFSSTFAGLDEAWRGEKFWRPECFVSECRVHNGGDRNVKGNVGNGEWMR